MTAPDQARPYQDALIRMAKLKYPMLSDATIAAFYAIPRHQFIDRFLPQGGLRWIEVKDENLGSTLPDIYIDHAMLIHEEKKRGEPSWVATISQPSFVLFILEKLQLKSGQNVFELGTGSAWNAALMAELVGPSGHVVTTEIIPKLAQVARKRLKDFGLENVKVIEGDGTCHAGEDILYDRAIFTAGALDLPQLFFDRLKDQALLMFVMRNPEGADVLVLFQKQGERFKSLEATLCGFVPVTGEHAHTLESRHYSITHQDALYHLTSWLIEVFPISKSLSPSSKQVLKKSLESQFLWTPV